MCYDALGVHIVSSAVCEYSFIGCRPKAINVSNSLNVHCLCEVMRRSEGRGKVEDRDTNGNVYQVESKGF
jgi:hypothetical protein